jgi:magnesium transporter
MVHLSEVLGVPVFDAEGARLGRIDDLKVDTVLNRVDRLLVRQGPTVVAVPWSAVETFAPESRRVTLAVHAETEPAQAVDGETIHLKRDVLDRQIIDIQGRKVVRVNDIMLETIGDELFLRRVEVGLAGAVRRMLAGLLSPRLVRRVADGLPEQGIWWDYVGLVEPRSSRIRLKVHQQLVRMHPADLADILEDLGRIERSAIVSQMGPEVAADALAEAEPSVQAAVVETLQTDKAADVLEEMRPDEAADVLGDLSQARSRELLDAMEADEAQDVRQLLGFPDDAAGGLMRTEFFKASAAWSVAETLARLREAHADLVSDIDEIPIVGDDDVLLGVAPVVQLVRANPEATILHAVRREGTPVTPGTPFKEVLERFDKYHLRALSVVDEFGVLVGLISIDDVFSRLAAAS